MKQKKFGKKVQNWHRPLGSNEKNAKFLRTQYKDPIYTDDGKIRGTVHDYFPDYDGDIDYDEFWNKYDPHDPYVTYYSDRGDALHWWYDHYDEEQAADAESTDVRQFKNWMEDLLVPTDLELKIKKVLAVPTFNDYSKIEHRAPAHDTFETDLFEISEFENYIKDPTGQLVEKIRSAAGHKDNIKVIHNLFPGIEHQQIRYYLILFAPFWVRLPIHWDPEEKVSFFQHLFCVYKTPQFLNHEWERSGNRMRKKWIVWFILLGQGASLQQAAKTFQWQIPKKFTHFLFEATEFPSPMLACIYAQIKCLGGGRWEYENLIRNDYFLYDPTEHYPGFEPHIFWKETVHWLINHREEMTSNPCQTILNWGVHCFTETRHRGVTFSWKGRSVTQSLARANQYQESLKITPQRQSWKPRGWNWSKADEDGHLWHIEELTNGLALFEEGQFMGHCVHTYTNRCVSGHCAIFSLTKDKKKKVTIEIYPLTKTIIQIRGKGNRMATGEEKSIADQWLTQLKNV